MASHSILLLFDPLSNNENHLPTNQDVSMLEDPLKCTLNHSPLLLPDFSDDTITVPVPPSTIPLTLPPTPRTPLAEIPLVLAPVARKKVYKRDPVPPISTSALSPPVYPPELSISAVVNRPTTVDQPPPDDDEKDHSPLPTLPSVHLHASSSSFIQCPDASFDLLTDKLSFSSIGDGLSDVMDDPGFSCVKPVGAITSRSDSPPAPDATPIVTPAHSPHATNECATVKKAPLFVPTLALDLPAGKVKQANPSKSTITECDSVLPLPAPPKKDRPRSTIPTLSAPSVQVPALRIVKRTNVHGRQAGMARIDEPSQALVGIGHPRPIPASKPALKVLTLVEPSTVTSAAGRFPPPSGRNGGPVRVPVTSVVEKRPDGGVRMSERKGLGQAAITMGGPAARRVPLPVGQAVSARGGGRVQSRVGPSLVRPRYGAASASASVSALPRSVSASRLPVHGGRR